MLEHIPDPVQALKKLHTVPRPGGFLYLDLSNIGSLGHEIYERHWRGLEEPRHLTLPSFIRLNASLRNIGFVNIERHQNHLEHGMVRQCVDGQHDTGRKFVCMAPYVF